MKTGAFLLLVKLRWTLPRNQGYAVSSLNTVTVQDWSAESL
ncbi:hypothetical protein [Trichocoleus sp. FACHB-90]